jgi:predicted ATPase/DNA-binding SARP family transcriptional activator
VSDPLQVRVLGALELERAGHPVQLGSPLQRRLLTRLVIAHGAPVSVERLIEELWGEDPPTSATNTLQSHVTRLRSALGDRDVIVTRPPGYGLDRARVEVDADRFEAALHDARRLLPTDPERAMTSAGDALGLWRGDAHAGIADAAARTDAARLERLRTDARLLLADACRRRGDPAAAVSALTAAITDDPLREDAAIGLAQALAAAGRRSEALDALRSHRSRIADELGLDPTPVFASTERALLRGELDPTDPGAPAGTDATGSTAPQVARPGQGSTSSAPPPASAAPTPTRPPRIGTETVGRASDLMRIRDALASAPIVTLVGPGGVGKTRLATVIATERVAGGSGTAWVDLSGVRSRSDVVPMVAEGIGTGAVAGADATQATVLALSRFDGLVVIDNCEHVLESIASLVDATLAHNGPVRLLATSRERLDVPGESSLVITPLPVPDPSAASVDDPAVALFLDRLRSAGGDRVASDAAARVVQAVDGLPLAIELAAARAATLPVASLLERLPRHLDVLAGTRRRHGDRQRTLTDVIGWSHDLLDDDEQRLFRRLAVFAASFGLDDVERICADTDASATADRLARLVERSMVTREGGDRFRLLEPLRVFAANVLDRSPDVAEVHARQRDWALGLADRADVAMTGPDEGEVVGQLLPALPDLRAVHARAVEAGDERTVARLTAGLYRFAYAQARQDVLVWGTDLAAPARDREPGAEPTHLRAIAANVSGRWMAGRTDAARALAATYAPLIDAGGRDAERSHDAWTTITLAETLGDLRVATGELPGAVRAYERQIRAAEEVGHDGLRSIATASLAIARTFLGEHDEAVRLARHATTLAERDDVPTARSLAAYALGEAVADHRPDEALEAFDLACEQASRVGARFFEGIARTADVALRGRHGEPSEALARYRTALQLWHDTAADGLVLTALRNLVVLLVRIGADAPALTLEAAVTRVRTHDTYGEEARRLAGALDAARSRLGEDGTAAARRAARDLGDLSEATRFGLDVIDAASSG